MQPSRLHLNTLRDVTVKVAASDGLSGARRRRRNTIALYKQREASSTELDSARIVTHLPELVLTSWR